MKELIEAVMELKYEISISEEFIECVLKRLETIGYKVEKEDIWEVSFCIKKVIAHIKNICNIEKIPEGLLNIAIDMVCGEFLYLKNQTGKLKIDDIDLNGVIEQITEGDVSVKFVNGLSDEEKLSIYIDYLRGR